MYGLKLIRCFWMRKSPVHPDEPQQEIGMHIPIKNQCFKAYDIRGQVPLSLNEDIAYRIGRAMVAELQGKNIVLGRDVRKPSISGCNGSRFT
ncbi:hypothetical protein EMIT0324P_30161 [Pseudomonas chlororaphis]